MNDKISNEFAPKAGSGFAGRKMLLTLSAMTAAGMSAADYNKTHLFNPEWTLHSKFLDAMMVTTRRFAGWGRDLFSSKKTGCRKTRQQLGAVLAGFYWLAC